MQRYCWPGFEMHLLGELQRQQNSAQFCDTLLQTDGISVPTHSCILAALSPYLSQRLSASPSPPSGQIRQLQLQPMKAQTLLKLVGLLYSGELEVKGSVEQNDMLAVACLFGIRDLVEVQKNGGMKEGRIQMQSPGSCKGNDIHAQGSEREESLKMQDVQVQTEMVGRRSTHSEVEHRSCVSTGTQTVKAGERSVDSCITCPNKAPTPECAPSVAQNVAFSPMLQPQNITLDKQFCFPSCPNGGQNGTWPTLERSACSVKNPKSSSSLTKKTMTFTGDESDTLAPQKDSTYQQFSECRNSIQALSKERTGLKNGKTSGYTADNRETTEQTHQASRDEVLGDKREKRQAYANVGKKNLAKMKQMQQMLETTQISIKVKLRRRTNGEVWEVVSPQDTDKTLSVLSFQQQDGSNHKGLQTVIEPPPSTVKLCAVHKPETLFLPPTTIFPVPLPNPNTPCDCFTPNQRHGLEAAPLPQPVGPVEESDEQIQKLLEDIMMGLNILPTLESDGKKSYHVQPSHDGVSTIFQVPVTQNDAGHSQIHTSVSGAGCVLYQDLETQHCHTSTDTGIHCCLAAQNQPDVSISTVQPDSSLIQQLQQCSSQYHLPVTSMVDRDEMSCQSMLPSKSQECLHPEAPMKKSVTPSDFFSTGQEQHYPEFQVPSSQQNQQIQEFLSLVTEKERQSLHTVPLPCMDDLRLPRCLSPLELCTSATKHQAIVNLMNLGDKVQQQPSLHGRPWLTENPGSLKFPLKAINQRKKRCVSLTQDTNRSCCSNQQQEHQGLNSQNGGTLAELCTVQEMEERKIISAGVQIVAELKSDPSRIKTSLKCQQDDTSGDAITSQRRKRKPLNHPQDADFLSADKHVKVSDGPEGEIMLSGCSVRLLRHSVVVKPREMATSSSNIPSSFVGKLNQPSTITESLRTESGVNAKQSRIVTRGFMKKNQGSPSNTSPWNYLVPKTVSFGAKVVNNGETDSKRKRGRPPKAKADNLPSLDNSPAVAEVKSHSGESEQQIDKDLSKKDLKKGHKRKRDCIKRKNRSTDVWVTPLKTLRNETISKPDTNNNDTSPAVRKLGTSKPLRMVSLKEFQKLIKLRHSKTKKSKKSQGTNQAVNEGMASRDSTSNESSKKTKMDAHTLGSGKNEESPVIFSVTVEENHFLKKSAAEMETLQQDDTESSSSKETSLFGDSAAFSCDVLQEEVPRLDADRKKPRKNPDEGGKSCDAEASITTQETPIDSEGSNHSDSHLLQANKLVSGHNVYNQAPLRIVKPLSNHGGISRTSCYDQEEEDVEVDVLVVSPENMPQTRVCEYGLNNLEIMPAEDEEEDMNEIDVTGD